MSDKIKFTTQEAASAYEATINVFRSLLNEIKTLSNKKPDAVMNTFKVSQINRLLNDIRDFLKDEPEVKYLDLLDDQTLPQIADAVVIMAQYEGALKGFNKRYHKGFWNIEEKSLR